MSVKKFSHRIYLLFMFVIIVLFIFFLTFLYQKMTDLSSPFPAIADQSKLETGHSAPLFYIGVVSRFPPTFIYKGYQPVIDFLSRNTPYRFELKLSKSYKQTVEQLIDGKVVAAFLGSFIFARTMNKGTLKAILRPLSARGKPQLQAAVICKTEAHFHSIADLKGKSVALPSAMSFSSNWFLKQALNENGLTKSDLDSIHFFAHHHTVVYEVLKGHFDVGVVKDRVANEFRNRGIRVVARSEPIPSSPVVVSDKSPPAVVQAIKKALLTIDIHQSQYQKLLTKWDAEFAFGFVPAKNEDYRVLLTLLKKQEAP